jgi:dipeptidyl aminopeptidase/acylaminoacyl peptidase
MPVRLRSCLRHALLATLVLPLALHAQGGISIEQVMQLQTVTTAELSPDGRQVAYTVTRMRGADEAPGGAYTELWVVPAAGGAPRAVMTAPRTASAPKWSPDGRWLAFTARLEANPQSQVYALPAGGGDPRPLTNSPTGVMSYAWSPTADRVAYTALEPEAPDLVQRRQRGFDMVVYGEHARHTRLWVQPVGGGQPTAVTPNSLTVRDFAWAPDGNGFAVQITAGATVDDDMMERRLMTVAATGGTPSLLIPTPGKLASMAWSPDGTQLAFLAATTRNDPLAQSVYVVQRDGRGLRLLTEGLEASVDNVGWMDARTIWFQGSMGTKTVLNRVPAAGGPIQRIAGGGAEVFTAPSFDQQKQAFVVAASTAQHPAEIFRGEVRTGALTRVTRHNDWLSTVALGRQETIEWIGPDSLRIEGVLVYPVGYREGVRYPLAILPHGGPEGVDLDGWTTRSLYPAQWLAGMSYAVLLPNYRASAGRGVAFSKADHRDLGGKEFDDVLAGIDHLAERGIVDADRVGISGTSYGGFFAGWAATRHTERFKAAAFFAGISNWTSFTGTTDIPHEMSLVHWDLYWFDNPGQYWDRSPLAYINQANTPTLVATGGADERVHPAQAMEFHQALRLKGVPTELVIYPRQPHGLRDRAHQVDFMERLGRWFDRYLKGEGMVP